MSVETAEICLVNPPFAAVERPSLALGLLKAILVEGGLAARVVDANLWLLDRIGVGPYRSLAANRPGDLLGDWLFAAAAFPEHPSAPEEYFDLLASRSADWRELGSEQRARLLALRDAAGSFVDEAARRILERGPRIVGCSSTFAQHTASLALLRRVRELAPEVVTLLGGASCEAVMGRATHAGCGWVDYLVSGEADGLIVDLCRAVLDGAAPTELPAAVLTPAHREGGDPGVEPGGPMPRAVLPDLEGIPLPDFDDYFAELERTAAGRRIVPGLSFESSRGCWWGQKWQCTFCGLNGEGFVYRAKKPGQVRDELEALAARYGTARLAAADNVMDLSFFGALLPRLAASRTHFALFYEVRPTLKRAQVEQLRSAGVRWIQPGVESLHTGALELMSKGTTAWRNLQLLKWCRESGIWVAWHIIAGFPGEDDAWYQEMAELVPRLHHLQPGNVRGLCFDRFSDYVSNPGRTGLDLEFSPMYRCVYPFPDEQLADLAYFHESRGAILPSERTLIGLEIDPSRPGVAALCSAMRDWLVEAAEREPVLVGRELDGSGLEVEDTRACARRRLSALTRNERLVLDRCEAAPRQDALAETLVLEGVDPGETRAAMDRLLADGFVVALDGRLVSLVLREPVLPLPADIEYPLGVILPEELLA